MAVYQRADTPFWWYDFTVNGRRFRGSSGATGKQAAKAVEAVRRQEAAVATPQSGRWRVRTMTGTYLEAHAQHLPSAYTIGYQLENLNSGLGPNLFISELTGEHVINYRAKRRGAGLANASVNRELALLKACINFAATYYGQARPSIVWKGLLLKEPAGRTRFLSTTEYNALMAACDDELRTMILVAVATGLRRDNIESMEWAQINLDHGVASVTLKGGAAHSVKLNAAVVAALARSNDRTGKVFKQPNKRKRWEKARTDARLVDFRFHDLRHTFASWARLAGADIAAICEAMHHSDVKMTMRYAHLTPDSKLTAFDAVSGRFFGVAARSTSRKVRRRTLNG